MARAGQGTSAFASIGEPITGKVVPIFHVFCIFCTLYFFISHVVFLKVVALLRHALQPCISSVTVDWGLGGEEDNSVVGPPQLETKKTLFGYGKPKASSQSQTVRWQAPAKVHAFVFTQFFYVSTLILGASHLRWDAFACVQTPTQIDTRRRVEGGNLIFPISDC